MWLNGYRLMVMDHYFDFSSSLLRYFHEIDLRLAPRELPRPSPAELTATKVPLSGIRAVLWDVYGTIFGCALGDLQQTLRQRLRLESVSAELIKEFDLGPVLRELAPESPPAEALAGRLLELIAQSHSRSSQAGVEYPEVLIERIWRTILEDCTGAGYRNKYDEPALETAYRWTYFFDSYLQKTYIYPGIPECICRFRELNLKQGIISNAQFYTPLHLRRLLRQGLARDDMQLDELFDGSLVMFSYELGFSKPNLTTFEQAVVRLKDFGIAPEQTVYIGNDMLNDIRPAKQIGWKTVLMAIDSHQTKLHLDEPGCVGLEPDAIALDGPGLATLVAGG